MLSGGVDSASLAAWRRPAGALVIDYGQRPAKGELIAAGEVARALAIDLDVLSVDCSQLGSGLLVGGEPTAVAPSSEWWPFRNQLLVTLAAAWALPRAYEALVLGSVRSDGFHADGRPDFYQRLDDLLASQEGGLRVLVPAIRMTTVELVRESAIPDSILGWTTSCHRGPDACGDCPGCNKRRDTLVELGRLT